MTRLTWPTREQPILEALFDLEESGEKRVLTSSVADTVGLPEAEVVRAVRGLVDADYIRVTQWLGVESQILITPRLQERGRRAIGQWPADSFDAFVAVLSQRIAEEREPEVRSKLQRLLDAVTGIGRDVATDVIAATIKHSAGI